MKRQADLHQCPRCRTWVLTGPDADIAAITVTINTQPIPATHEWRELVEGRTTYTVHNYPHHPEIAARDHWAIQANRHPQIWVTHKCGTPKTGPPQQQTLFPATIEEEELNETPPF